MVAMVYITPYYNNYWPAILNTKCSFVQLKKDMLKITSNRFTCTNAIYFTTSDSEAFSVWLCLHDLSAIVIHQFSHQSYTNKAQRSADWIWPDSECGYVDYDEIILMVISMEWSFNPADSKI